LDAQEKLSSLNDVLKYAKTSTFYAKRLPHLPLRTLADIKQIPITTKNDLRQHSPFGLLPNAAESLAQYHESSGTTGRPVAIWYSKTDLDEISNQIATNGFKFKEKDIVLIRFPYALSTISHFIHQTVQKQNGCVVPADSRTTVTPMPKVIDLLQTLHVTVLACNSLQSIMLAEVAEMNNLNPKTDFPALRAIYTAGEPLTPFRRALIEDIWGVPVFDNYGMTEAGTIMVDCSFQQLHLFEDCFHVEVLEDDLQTAVKDGDCGNLVVTTLRKRATPMIRYLTGDIVQVNHHPCSCGSGCSYQIRGRKDEMLTINTIRLDLYVIEKMISRLPARRFWTVGKWNNHLYLFIEKESDYDMVSNEYVETLRATFGIGLSILLLEKGTLYDRHEPLSFGMKAKPRYYLTDQETESLLNQIKKP
jgi:phenylacetate-CoA ligase